MIMRVSMKCAFVLGALLLGVPAWAQQQPTTSAAWTLDEALSQLQLYPKDPYLQYVTLQLARQENRVAEIATKVQQAIGRPMRRAGRRNDVDLFGIFSGALAVQESLQLDTMVGDEVGGAATGQVERDARPADAADEPAARENARPADAGREDAGRDSQVAPQGPVSLADLQGPTVKSHPWAEMLQGRKPELSTLANCVPDDFYYVRFRSVDKLLTVLDSSDMWATHIFSQTVHKAYSHLSHERIKRQLAVEVSELVRPFYDLAVQEVGVVGSDLFAIEGSDVSLLFNLSQPPLFKAQMDAFLVKAESSSADVKRTTGVYRDIPFVHLTCPDRRVHVFSAYPKDTIHVRSNSRVAFARILDAIASSGGEVGTLGASDEFAYIRTLMPLGAEQEDGFVYLSDPFIRHMVGPQLKLTERRRRLCNNHLRMIGHAAVLHQTQFGEPAESLAELTRSGCAPGNFGQDKLSCPCQGTYSLSEDGLMGVCSHHGRPGAMVPCCEIPLAEVSQTEAEAYRAFEQEYSRYWRTFFDPIAVRLQMTPSKYRLETIVLPLIDNSLYTGMAMVLGGEPAALDIPPIPDSNIFSVAAKFNKEKLLVESGWIPPGPETDASTYKQRQIRGDAQKLMQMGLGMHNYHDVHRHFPRIGRFDEQKKQPLLSWRVHLLPFLGHEPLYREFRLDEPWDSEHNRKLIGRMPDVYLSTLRKPTTPGTTTFVRTVGPDMICTGTEKETGFRDIQDGTSNTVLIFEVGEKNAVIWTKPTDFTFDKATIREAFFQRFEDSALVCLADGSNCVVPDTISDDTLLAIFTRAGGETVDGPIGRFVSSRRQGLPFDLDELAGPGFESALGTFITDGLSDKVGFHVCDADPMFDFQLVGFLGQSLGSFSGRRGFGIDDDFLPVVLLIASLNAPVYVSLPLNDAAVTDQFLAAVDEALARYVRRPERGGFFELEKDYYTLPLAGDMTAQSGRATWPDQMAILLGAHWRFAVPGQQAPDPAAAGRCRKCRRGDRHRGHTGEITRDDADSPRALAAGPALVSPGLGRAPSAFVLAQCGTTVEPGSTRNGHAC